MEVSGCLCPAEGFAVGKSSPFHAAWLVEWFVQVGAGEASVFLEPCLPLGETLQGVGLMANFTSETLVRDTFQFANVTAVPVALVTQSMDDAHVEILRVLDASVDTGNPDAGLITGETILAGARVLRSLSWGHAADQKHLALGGSRIEEGNRYRELQQAASVAESQAWYMLEPYVREVPSGQQMDTTASVPILEEG